MRKINYYYEALEGVKFLNLYENEMNDILWYQIDMIANNPSLKLETPSYGEQNGISFFSYNTKNYVPLKEYFSSNELTISQLASIISTICIYGNIVEEYLLDKGQLVLDMELILISPETYDVKLLYYPCKGEHSFDDELKELVASMLTSEVVLIGENEAEQLKLLKSIRTNNFSPVLLEGVCSSIIFESENKDEALPQPQEQPSKRLKPKNKIVLSSSNKQHKIETTSSPKPQETNAKGANFCVQRPEEYNEPKSKASRFKVQRAKEPGSKEPKSKSKPRFAPMLSPMFLGILLIIAAILFYFTDIIADINMKKYAVIGLAIIGLLLTFIKTDKKKKIIQNKPDPSEKQQSNSDETIMINIADIYFKGELIDNYNQNKKYKITDGEYKIGRNDENQIVIKDPSVGKEHAVIYVNSNGVFLRDLASKNGTYINSERVRKNRKMRLIDNDIVRFADSEYLYKENV